MRHAKALEGVGEVVDGEGAWNDLELVASVKTRIGSHSEASSGAPDDETTAGDGMRILAL